MSRKNSNARQRITPRKLKIQPDIRIEVRQPYDTYKPKGDIYPGRVAAEAWIEREAMA